jgi:hypothetical protein
VELPFLSVPANILPDVMPTVSRYERQRRRLLGLHCEYWPLIHRFRGKKNATTSNATMQNKLKNLMKSKLNLLC